MDCMHQSGKQLAMSSAGTFPNYSEMETVLAEPQQDWEFYMVGNGHMQRNGLLTLSLPSLDEKDPLFMEKKRLLHARNFNLKFQLLPPLSSGELLLKLDDIVQEARILYLNDVELYFIDDDDFGPFSPRNELESLNAIHKILIYMLSGANLAENEILIELQNAIVGKINSIADQSIEQVITEKVDTTAEELLLKWGESHGARLKVTISYFVGANRGAMALEDINIGESALEIPENIIISEDLLNKSDMFKVLMEWDGMTTETMLLLWSMRERYNLLSDFKNYFETLPNSFNTGLSFGINALSKLHGTLVFEEIMQAKEHLRQQYDSLCPALCARYPDIFQPELYSWDHYLWACELWYSNGMKVIFSDGKLRTCLVPIAGFLNHSVVPHILNYGRVDPESKSLKFQLARQCKRGEQCYLSYGSLPGSHLVTFYGFLPKEDNPYDVIPLDFEIPDAADNIHSQAVESSRSSCMVRGTWLSGRNKPPTYGLPPPLLNHLRLIMKNGDIQRSPVAPENEDEESEKAALLQTIISIFEPMMEGLQEPHEPCQDDLSWDGKLALEYRDLQRRIVSSVLSSCIAGLEGLGST